MSNHREEVVPYMAMTQLPHSRSFRFTDHGSYLTLSDSRNGFLLYGGQGEQGPLSDVWVSVADLYRVSVEPVR
jgi:hypothetical protein